MQSRTSDPRSTCYHRKPSEPSFMKQRVFFIYVTLMLKMYVHRVKMVFEINERCVSTDLRTARPIGKWCSSLFNTSFQWWRLLRRSRPHINHFTSKICWVFIIFFTYLTKISALFSILVTINSNNLALYANFTPSRCFNWGNLISLLPSISEVYYTLMYSHDLLYHMRIISKQIKNSFSL